MRKFKTTVTVVLVVALSISMCGMMFGYAYNREYLNDALVVSGDEVCNKSNAFKPAKEENDVTPNVIENSPMQPYYVSIETEGKYEVGVYTKSGTSWTEFDSAFRNVYATDNAGFYSSVCNFSTTQGNYPFIRGLNGIKMQLDHLKVRYN